LVLTLKTNLKLCLFLSVTKVNKLLGFIGLQSYSILTVSQHL